MKISEMIAALEALKVEHGDLPVFIKSPVLSSDGTMFFDITYKKDIEYYDEHANDYFVSGVLIA